MSTLEDIDSGLNMNRMILGPVYLVDDVILLLDATPDVVARKTRFHELVSLRTDDNYVVYPAWQFDHDGKVSPHIKTVYDIIHRSSGSDHFVSEWDAALWLGRYEYGTYDGRTGNHRRVHLLRGHHEEVIRLVLDDHMKGNND